MEFSKTIFTTLLIFSCFVTVIVSIYSLQISNYLNLIDKPDFKRKLHKKNVPLTGSIPIILIFVSILLLNIFFEIIKDIDYILILISSLCIYFVGFIDDKFGLTPLKKIFLISIVTIITITNSNDLIVSRFYISFYDTFFYTDYFAIFFTVLCLLTLTNAFNLIDGINGLATGVLIIWLLSYIFFFSNSFNSSQLNGFNFFIILLSINLLIIFYFNFRGNFFLGDSGSLFLSYFFGLIIIKSVNTYYNQDILLGYSAENLFLIFLIPFSDMIRVMILRIEKRTNPFRGDRNHFHHLVFDYFNQSNISIIVYFTFITIPIILSSIFHKYYSIKPIIIIIIAIFVFLIICKLIYRYKNIK